MGRDRRDGRHVGRGGAVSGTAKPSTPSDLRRGRSTLAHYAWPRTVAGPEVDSSVQPSSLLASRPALAPINNHIVATRLPGEEVPAQRGATLRRVACSQPGLRMFLSSRSPVVASVPGRDYRALELGRSAALPRSRRAGDGAAVMCGSTPIILRISSGPKAVAVGQYRTAPRISARVALTRRHRHVSFVRLGGEERRAASAEMSFLSALWPVAVVYGPSALSEAISVAISPGVSAIGSGCAVASSR